MNFYRNNLIISPFLWQLLHFDSSQMSGGYLSYHQFNKFNMKNDIKVIAPAKGTRRPLRKIKLNLKKKFRRPLSSRKEVRP